MSAVIAAEEGLIPECQPVRQGGQLGGSCGQWAGWFDEEERMRLATGAWAEVAVRGYIIIIHTFLRSRSDIVLTPDSSMQTASCRETRAWHPQQT
mgnify:CR=1 FL=1